MSVVVLKDIGTLVTMQAAMKKHGRFILEKDLSIKKNQAIVIKKNKIAWIGSNHKIPKILDPKIREYNLNKMTVLPGLIECHTHSSFLGSRAFEFELRNQGRSYQDITTAGGGIHHSVSRVKKASLDVMVEETVKHVKKFSRQGVTTVEIKSGYGLDLKNEIKILEAIQLATKQVDGLTLVPTFLGAHAKPKSHKMHDEYLKYLVKVVLPVIRKNKLANRVDIFIEKGFFEKDLAKSYLSEAKSMGFDLTIHADQLSLSGGARLAVELGAKSADHLICINEKVISLISKSDVTAVLLPTADLYMNCSYPPARRLLDAGARVALSTDFNPGTSPSQDINLVSVLARATMKMKLAEVVSAWTIAPAYALGLEFKKGMISVGYDADFSCFEVDYNDLFYRVGDSSCVSILSMGKFKNFKN
jgi:imidazolonepropionase